MPLPTADPQLGLEEVVINGERADKIADVIVSLEEGRDTAKPANAKVRKAKIDLEELLPRAEVENKRIRIGETEYVIDGNKVDRHIPGPGSMQPRFAYSPKRLVPKG